MHPGEVWYGKNLKARLTRLLLLPFSWLYGMGWLAYQGVYRIGLKRPKEPHSPVVCVGNLKVGGSGKSPLVIHLAKLLREMGHDVVIGASGYGSPRSEGASVTPEGELDPKEWGDEPAMLRWVLPGVPFVVGRNRVRAAWLCHQHYPNAILLMDDGFQHLPLKKHLSIVIDRPGPNRHCLPAGPYREPAWLVSRADLVLPGRFSLMGEITGFAHPYKPGATLERGSKVALLCALGEPTHFRASVEESGMTVVQALFLPDHDPLLAGNLLAPFEAKLPIVTTAKDWVKLKSRPDIGERDLWIATYDLHVEPSDPFRSWLEARLRECQAQT
ncbi:MAG: tetraacyldisaccharide 4'-kinase [Armatimonadetes bacterium]|nr:tetraacyldisaccharide 4'-kinase [Armatimonadota bacterium]